MSTSLTTALQNAQIGNKYDLLGYKRDWWDSKLYLSYSHDEGWKVKRLDIFRQIIRAVFGFYGDTHLEHVVKKLSATKKVPIGLTYRIEELWVKTHGYHSPLVKKQPVGQLALFGYQKDICNLAIRYKSGTPIFKGLLQLDNKYKYHAIAGDGHCLFRSIGAGMVVGLSQAHPDTLVEIQEKLDDVMKAIKASDDLKKYYKYFLENTSKLFDPQNKQSPEQLLRNQVVSDRLVKFLRLLACEYIASDDNLKGFLAITTSADDYLKDMNSMSKAKMGGHVEIKALVETLGLDITLLDVDGVGKGGNPGQKHYKHTAGGNTTVGINLLYLNQHYNLAVPG